MESGKNTQNVIPAPATAGVDSSPPERGAAVRPISADLVSKSGMAAAMWAFFVCENSYGRT